MVFEVICIDCEEGWDIDREPVYCTCDDPADDAWILYIDGKHVGGYPVNHENRK